MPGGDVGNFMRHYAGKLGLFVRSFNQAGVDVKEPARQRHRVDVVGFDDFDGEGNFRVRVANQVLTHAIDVFVDYRIINQLNRTLEFGGQLAAQLHLFFERHKIDAVLIDVPIADVFDIRILRQLLVGFWRSFVLRQAGGNSNKRDKQRRGRDAGEIEGHILSPGGEGWWIRATFQVATNFDG